MKQCTIICVFLLGVGAAGLAQTQSPPQSQAASSLGDLARQLREQRAKSGQKAEKVFTNENLPRPGLHDGVIVVGNSQTSEERPKEEAKAASSSKGHGEKYYRETIKELRATKELHERELAVLEKSAGENSVQYYSDPNKTLQQEFSRSDINKKMDAIEKKKREIAADDKAISDLQEQCNRDREGCAPGWLR